MPRAGRFEDLIAWQKARELARAVYADMACGKIAHDFGLAGQMQRAAVSVMSNIAQGMERAGAAELHHFLTIAKGSCAEVRSQLYVARDVGYIADAQFSEVMELAEETGRVIGGLRASVSRSRAETG